MSKTNFPVSYSVSLKQTYVLSMRFVKPSHRHLPQQLSNVSHLTCRMHQERNQIYTATNTHKNTTNKFNSLQCPED
uniref:Uncharacterized protein n=1 Tax=Arion vulgaris TaxID=1028688 RepID=A0A0B6YBU1_9EUPU